MKEIVNFILCGYLGKDFELVIGTNTYAKTSIAISESREKEGEIVNHTNWIPIIIFGKKAEVAHKYFKKGDKFLGSGKIHTSSFTKGSGEVSYSWQVIINEFEFLNKKESKDNEGQVTEFDESEIPF